MQGPENVTIKRFVIEKPSYSESLSKSGVACLCELLLPPERLPTLARAHNLLSVSCFVCCGLWFICCAWCVVLYVCVAFRVEPFLVCGVCVLCVVCVVLWFVSWVVLCCVLCYVLCELWCVCVCVCLCCVSFFEFCI